MRQTLRRLRGAIAHDITNNNNNNLSNQRKHGAENRGRVQKESRRYLLGGGEEEGRRHITAGEEEEGWTSKEDREPVEYL